MGFSLKKIGRSITSLAKTAAPILSVIPGPTMVIGTAASAGFAARDAVKAKKAQAKANSQAMASGAQDTSTIASSGFLNPDTLFSGMVGAGPSAPASDPEKTGNATAFNMSSLTSKINPLYIVLGFLVLLLVFMVARRK